MIFFLGTHRPVHLTRTEVPLFVSRRTLTEYKTLPVARGPWALDSGGFTELSMHGRWTITEEQYVAEVRRYRDEIGNLAWAAPMDWMCEPVVRNGGVAGFMRFKGTGLSIWAHQVRTVANYCRLKQLAPDLPFIPVLQGFTESDFLHCIKDYRLAGVRLETLPLVGLGSVCRRQGTDEVLQIVETLSKLGLRLHGFGFKLTGLARGCSTMLKSADSLAWSFDGRRGARLPGCTHKSCANCLPFALSWRTKALRAIQRGENTYSSPMF